jgi:hypothetical protein
MIELRFTQNTPQYGEVKVWLRVIGKIIYMKFNNSPYAQQMITQIAQKGANIIQGNTWIRINMFCIPGQTTYKIGKMEFDIEETKEEEIETVLANFYKEKYTQAGFI